MRHRVEIDELRGRLRLLAQWSMPETSKTWWAPVWRGLVADPTGKHLRSLGRALGLLVYLIVHADRETGVVRQRQATIAREMGFRPRTIRAWLRRLRERGYVAETATGRARVLRIAKWRSLRSLWHNHAAQSGTGMPLRAARFGPGRGVDDPKRRMTSDESARGAPPDKSISTRVLLRQRLTGYKATAPTTTDECRRPRSRHELLAADLADGLGDRRGYPHYLRYARRYPEPLLRRLLSEARAVPASAIKRSRAALFEYLLTRYATTHPPEDSRD